MTIQKFYQNFYNSVEEQFLTFGRHIPDIILAILIIVAGILISKQVAKLTRKAISYKTNDAIMIDFLAKGIKFLVAGFFIMYALKISGLQYIASGILTAAGASAVVIGFAFRDIGENFISGIILSFSRPFNVGDSVSIGDIFGKVNTIQFRYTKLRTFDGKDVYIPNSDVIKKPVFNYTEDGFIRFDFIVGIAFENSIDGAQEIILNLLKTNHNVIEDENHTNFVCADALSTNTVNLKVHFWIHTFEYGFKALSIRGQIIADVKEALIEAGYNLPANIVEMKMYESQTSIPFKVISKGQELNS